MRTPWEQYSDYCALIVWENKQVRKESQHEWGLKVISSYSGLSDSTSWESLTLSVTDSELSQFVSFACSFNFHNWSRRETFFFAVQTFLQSTWKSLKEVRARKSWSTTWTLIHPTSTTTKSKIKKKKSKKIPRLQWCMWVPMRNTWEVGISWNGLWLFGIRVAFPIEFPMHA